MAQIEFERIKNELGIKGNVKLLRNDDSRLKSPFVTGIRKRKVVIPYYEYSKEELDVIIYHELNHVKKSDIFFRYLTMAAITFNSINLISYFLLERVMIWSEADCDARALECLEKFGISTKQYYDVIFDMLGADRQAPDLFYYPMLMSASESLYRRMDIMKKYRASGKKIAKSVTVVLTVVFAMLSSVTAHAAGIGVAKANDKFLEENQELVAFDEFKDVSDWSEEMMVEADDDIKTIYRDDIVVTRAGSTFSWEVPAGTRYVTSSIYFSEGTEVQIACTASPSDCTYRFGLMHSSSTCYIVEGSGMGAHAFTVPSSGYYRVMVENRGSVTLSVNGGYSY